MSDGDYKIGYGRPPAHTRFRKGASGNPAGRAKGPNFAQQFIAAINETVPVDQGGRSVHMTKLQATILAMVDKGTKGDARAMAEVLDRVAELEARAEETSRVPALAFTEADRAVIAEIHRRMKACESEAARDAEPRE